MYTLRQLKASGNAFLTFFAFIIDSIRSGHRSSVPKVKPESKEANKMTHFFGSASDPLAGNAFVF